MDLEFSPSILNTPSLATPNLTLNQLIYKPSHTTIAEPLPTTNDSSSTTNIKLLKIEDDLKESFALRRQPTQSPFQIMAKAGSLTVEKTNPVLPTTDDGIPAEVPSTAEVMNDLESFSKFTTKDNTERETTGTASDNTRFETSSPTHTMGVIVSPKKQFLIRSQSRPDATSPPPPNNQFSQIIKTNISDEESSMDNDDRTSSINNHFQRVHDLPLLAHSTESNSQLDNHLDSSYMIQLRADQNGVHSTLVKQQPKRPFPGAPIPKSNPILISQQPFINEVSSSDPLLGIKRQKITPIPTNTVSLRPASSSSSVAAAAANNIVSDDNRKKQIRDSNREAARRCRERRRNYIEQLEGNLEQYKTQINRLSEKLSRAERENTQLRAIVTEAKIFSPATRLSLTNESMGDFSNAILTSNGIEISSETTDGNIIQRNFISRNTH